MTSSEVPEAMLCSLLRDRCGIDPDRLGDVLDLAAVGIVNSVWRNSPVEEWHVDFPALTDGAMLRVNAYTTWRVREIIRRWRNELGLAPDGSIIAVDHLDPDDIQLLAVRVFRWVSNPSRRLPIGGTLGELAGNSLPEFVEHADGTLGGFAASAVEHGPPSSALRRIAAHGGMACSHWWGTVTWPYLVRLFLAAVDDDAHEHWRIPGASVVRVDRPAYVDDDRPAFARLLLRRPWELRTDVADWVVRAGIGFLRHQLAVPNRE